MFDGAVNNYGHIQTGILPSLIFLGRNKPKN